MMMIMVPLTSPQFTIKFGAAEIDLQYVNPKWTKLLDGLKSDQNKKNYIQPVAMSFMMMYLLFYYSMYTEIANCKKE